MWDEAGGESAWTVGPSFDTVAHPYPNPNNFIYSPADPNAGAPMQFFDDVDGDSMNGDPFYDPASSHEWGWDMNAANGLCLPGGVPPLSSCDYYANDASPANADPIHSYGSPGLYRVTLIVQDDVGVCAKEKGVTVFPPPSSTWQEISPF